MTIGACTQSTSKIISLIPLLSNMTPTTRSMTTSSKSNVSKYFKSTTKIQTKATTSKYFKSPTNIATSTTLSSSSSSSSLSSSSSSSSLSSSSSYSYSSSSSSSYSYSPRDRKKSRTKKTKKTNGKEDEDDVGRTESFEPITDRTFNPNSKVQVHTLLLGTHPSVKSLEGSQYYGHPMNAFWWIAGDNLGFRRDTAISKSSGKPYKFETDLLYPKTSIIPYEEQLKTLTSNGFAIWDILKSCKRKGSLDQDIKEEIPNNIPDFCDRHPSIQRIVLCNGSSSVVFFNRHFKDWWVSSNKLQPGRNKESIQAFQKLENMRKEEKQKGVTTGHNDDDDNNQDHNKIECICGLGVSPAAAKFTYVQKRDFYTRYCYEPGLEDHRRLKIDGPRQER